MPAGQWAERLIFRSERPRRDEFPPAPRSYSYPDERSSDMPDLTPCLWFDTDGEAAAELYTSVFPNSKILDVTRYGPAGPRPEGTVMTVSFELDGQKFLALNGGPNFTFNEAVSFQIHCRDQDEVDHYWEKLGEGGEPGPCGWLKDRFGLSWQVVPNRLPELLEDPDREKANRVMAAMLEMGKIEIAELERAAEVA
jgi:predicted 3-demethylubiquinone-9 3-methyltransferase (glyoxalase superfamily)